MYLDVYGHWRSVVLTRELFDGPGDTGRKDEEEKVSLPFFFFFFCSFPGLGFGTKRLFESGLMCSAH